MWIAAALAWLSAALAALMVDKQTPGEDFAASEAAAARQAADSSVADHT